MKHQDHLPKRLPVALLTGLLIVISFSLSAQTLTLRFFDSVTGYRIVPRVLVLVDSTGDKMYFSTSDFARNSEIAFTLPGGVFSLTVQADGYQMASTDFRLKENASLNLHFHLDPIAPPEKFTSTYWRQQRRGDGMFISGIVTDRESGLPIENARIYSPDFSTQETRSDRDGYFRVLLPVEQEEILLICEKSGYQTRQYENISVWSGGDTFFRVRMAAGSGTEVIYNRRSPTAVRKDSEECDDCSNHSKSIGQTEHPGNFPNPILLKHTIRVGRNCTGTNCTTVEIYSLQTYCKFVLPAEWIACWGDLPNGMNSLRAGSVAVRTYASWFVYHPLSNNYDICDNTFCQMFGDNQYSNTNLAVDQTERMVMINASEEIVRSEYSAENNNSGCGDGWSGTGDTWPCIYDPVCLGQPNFGHGRGMCQWGSIRWANGTKVLPSSPCSEGINHGFGTKSWDEILAHYYPDYSLIEAYSAHILSAIPDPSVVSPGETFQIHYTIGAGPAMSLMLGASIAPAGTGNWIDDPAHDVKVSVNEGTSTVSRWFEIPPSASPGLYDMLVALWYDVDGNDLINSGDFVFHLISVPEALTVTPTDIQAEEHPPITSYSLQQNFPNPFNPATTIEFSLPQKAMVQLKIFDTNGKEIQTLLQKVLPSGVYQTQWSAEGVPSGTYFYRLKVYPQSKEQPIFIQTRKMTLIR